MLNFIPDELFAELNKNKPFILCGDLNCHSTKWFCSNTTPKGKNLADLIEKFDLNILNSDIPTISNLNPNSISIIDLLIVSNDLSDKFNSLKINSDNLTSDHYPLKVTFNIKT